MDDLRKCPKCSGEMTSGSNDNLGGNFACTRGEPNQEVPKSVTVQPYYCENCGYMEFYRESMEEER